MCIRTVGTPPPVLPAMLCMCTIEECAAGSCYCRSDRCLAFPTCECGMASLVLCLASFFYLESEAGQSLQLHLICIFHSPSCTSCTYS